MKKRLVRGIKDWRFFFLLSFFIFGLSLEAKIINWNEGRGYRSFPYSTSRGIEIDNHTDTLQYSYFTLSQPATSIKLRFRSKNLHGNPLKRYNYQTRSGKIETISNPHWGFFLAGESDTLVFIIKRAEEFEGYESKSCLEMVLYDMKREKKETIKIKDCINPHTGDNLWILSADQKGIEILAGEKDLNPVFTYPVITEKLKLFGFLAGWGDKLKISDISLEYEEILTEEETERKSLDEIIETISESDDEMEGYWILFDRDLEETLLKLGGDYRMVSIREGDSYLFLYLEGAGVNSRGWQPGDIKAIMTPTAFTGIYDVEWMDSQKKPLIKEIRAQRGEGKTLLITFPYQNSSIRLRKVD